MSYQPTIDLAAPAREADFLAGRLELPVGQWVTWRGLKGRWVGGSGVQHKQVIWKNKNETFAGFGARFRCRLLGGLSPGVRATRRDRAPKPVGHQLSLVFTDQP
jgi:hypothetical protein